MSLIDAMIETTQEVFSSMVSLSASAAPPFERADHSALDSLTGLIHFSGKHSGYAAINLSESTAKLIASSFLFMDTEDIDEEALSDSLGELANMLAGSVKSFLDPAATTCSYRSPCCFTDRSLLLNGSPDQN